MRETKPPKFQPGDRVFYPHIKQSGIVKLIINGKPKYADDVRRQGYRYEVAFDYGSTLWSVLESSLEKP